MYIDDETHPALADEEPVCGHEPYGSDDVVCTRPVGHTGLHIGHNLVGLIVAVWDDDRTTD